MKKIHILVCLAIFIVPISSLIPLQGYPLWYGQYIGLTFVLFLGVSLALWQFNKWLSIFHIYLLFSTFFVTNISPRAIILMMQFSLACLACFGISKLKSRKSIIYTIFGLVLLQSFWLVLQYKNIQVPLTIGSLRIDATFNSLKNPGTKELVAFAGSKDQLGTFFALTAPIVAKIHPILLILTFTGIFISKSSFALVAVLGSLTFYFWQTKSKLYLRIWLVSLILLSSFFFIKAENLHIMDFKTRLGVWKHAIKSTVKGEIEIAFATGNTLTEGIRKIKCNPLLGYGFGTFNTIFPYTPQRTNFNYIDEKFNHAHNDFVELFFELGYIGFIIFLLLLGNLIKGFKKSNKSNELVLYFSCIMAYLLNACGNFLSQLAVSGMFLIIYYGIYEGTRRENGKITTGR